MSFRIALSGLNAASSQLDVTANNISNAETTGFKSSRATFADVFASQSSAAASTSGLGGVQLSSVTQQFSQGQIEFTENNLDLAVNGEGFFTLKGSDGLIYTRAGEFSVDQDGFVVNNDLERLQVFPARVGGTFSTGVLEDLRIDTSENPPQASSLAELKLNLPSNAEVPGISTFDPTRPETFNHATSMNVFDSLGGSHTASFYFIKDGSADNSWQQRLLVDGNEVGTPSSLTFDAVGQLSAPASGRITVPPFSIGGGSADLELELDVRELTQYGSGFTIGNLSQDGFQAGQLSGVSIDQEGVVTARYSNRQAENIGKVALTQFANPEGLAQLGNTSWGESGVSGSPRLGESGTASFGLVQSGALEGSNVDITAQLVEMITAQRNFQANTQMISTADQVTQAIINIR